MHKMNASVKGLFGPCQPQPWARLFNYKRLGASLTPNQRENSLYIVYIILPEVTVRIDCLAISDLQILFHLEFGSM